MDFDINEIKKRFLGINQARLDRARESLAWRQRDFLDLLPVFFHLNHPMLPGFVSRQTPCGIPLFAPGPVALDALKNLSKSFKYKKRAQASYDIYSIFLMGSVGTIAYSKSSDLDVWVCHKPALPPQALEQLKQKCSGIEAWAEQLGLEVHIFLIDSEEFCRGEVAELSSESSGSTQYHLLLEEFYRTAMLLAGRYPVWWLVPPEEEANYEQWVSKLISQRFIPESDVIVLGAVSHVPAEEFFGAALWQVYKGIDSPYKSVLKILLMEVYASEFPESHLLGWDYKKLVYDGETDIDKLDPYIILLNKLQSYLVQRKELDRLELVRRCFYFKVKIPLSDPGLVKNSWRREILQNLVTEWGWGKAHLSMLDQRSNWKIRQVLAERRILVDELTDSYLFLSRFVREKINSARISQKDLNILGRKLYAAFERKAGKIELVNRGVSANVFERKLNLVQAVTGDGDTSWSLLSESLEDGNGTIIKRGRSCVEILAWCHFNQLIDVKTVIVLQNNSGILSLKEVRSVFDALEQMFPAGTIPVSDMEDFSQASMVKSACLFANVGLDPMPMHSRQGANIISDKTDILNYSGFSFNLALSFDLLVVNSWQEILSYRYCGVDGLMDCICECLRLQGVGLPQTFQMPVYSFSSAHSAAIARRIEQLFENIVLAFYKEGRLRALRYVIEVQKTFYLVCVEKDGFKYHFAKSVSELYDLLSKAQTEHIPIVFDAFALRENAISYVVSRDQPGKVQLFYEPNGDLVNVFILDEFGSMFFQQCPYYDDYTLLNHYVLFFSSVAKRQAMTVESLTDSLVDQLEFTRVEVVASLDAMAGQMQYSCRFESKSVQSTESNSYHVQVIGNMVDQKTNFTIYCHNQEFSSMEYGKRLFQEVALNVFSHRKSGEKYPIYITDLDLAPGLLGDRASSQVQIIDYLNCKKGIEAKLNLALQNL